MGDSSAAAGFAISAISTARNAYSMSQAQKSRGIYQQTINNINAQIAGFQAEDSIERGKAQAAEIKRKGEKDLAEVRKAGKIALGAQRVALATQGISITSGSASDILAETQSLISADEREIKRNVVLDAITIKNNAWREAWGYRTQAFNFTYRGRFAKLTGDAAARNTLISGGLRAISDVTRGASKLSFGDSERTTTPKRKVKKRTVQRQYGGSVNV